MKKIKKKKYTYSRDEMIEEIKKDTKVGKEFVRAEMKFLRALASGEIYRKLKFDPLTKGL